MSEYTHQLTAPLSGIFKIEDLPSKIELPLLLIPSSGPVDFGSTTLLLCYGPPTKKQIVETAEDRWLKVGPRSVVLIADASQYERSTPNGEDNDETDESKSKEYSEERKEGED